MDAEVREVHPRNADAPMEVTEGMEAEVSLVHP
jgi:hypothetical protein